MKGYEKLPDDAKEMSFWEPEEAQSFLKFLNTKFPVGSKDRWVYAVFLFALNTGLRAGEIWGLQPIDLSRKQSTIYAKRQWSNLTKSYQMLKSKRKNRQDLPYRHVPRSHELRAELDRVFTQRNIEMDETTFCGESRMPRGHDSFTNRFARLLREWAGRKIRFHNLRHTAITLWIHHRVNVRVVQEMAGHQSLQTTMKYVHMIGGSVEEASETYFLGLKEPSKTVLKLA